MTTIMDYPAVIHVQSRYLPDHLPEEEGKFVFAYHVTIQNQGNVKIQLLNRYWLITDGNGKQKEVRGEGVVGKQPIIEPGDVFSYTSGSVIDTPVGSMQGYYEMQTLPEAGESQLFTAPIDVFSLAVPNSLN